MAAMKPGSIGWLDLTVPDAPAIRDFYQSVAGWGVSSVDMGGYEDYCMLPPGAEDPVAGICHAQGTNSGIPPVWVPYITVEDLEASMSACRERGGEVVYGPKSFGSHGKFCMIRDPAGAVAGLFQYASEQPPNA